ncbi:uncharacterized protein METZ01_LOCUS263683, partial [marine metagenome]
MIELHENQIYNKNYFVNVHGSLSLNESKVFHKFLRQTIIKKSY